MLMHMHSGQDFPLQLFSFLQEWISGKETFTQPTSGSTGIPKLITLTRKQMLISATTTVQRLGWTASDTALICLHPGFIAGKMMLVRAIETGMAMVVTEPQLDPLAVLEIKQRQHLTVTAMVPMQLEHLCRHYGNTLSTITALRSVLLGGAAVPSGLQAVLPACKVPVWHTYGMTETCSHIALRRVDGKKPEGTFTVMPGVRLSVDKRGCLVVEGEVCLDGRVVTNDLVELLDEHSFLWLGRYDNTINSGGIKLHLDALEDTIGTMLLAEGIANRFMLTAIPDAKLGQALTMVVEEADTRSNSAERIRQTLIELPSYQRPKHLILLAAFPLTLTGKVDRQGILQHAMQTLA